MSKVRGRSRSSKGALAPTEVVTIGETMVLLAADSHGPLRYVRRFERYAAGAESNVAIGLTHLGHSVRWVSRLGDDEFGQYVLQTLRGEGVDVSKVTLDPHAPTGVFFKERRAPGTTRVHYYRSGSAASRLEPGDVNPGTFAGARILHVTGITPALSESCRQTVRRAVELARDGGLMISFDANYRPGLWSPDDARPVLAELASTADIVFVNQAEAELLTGEDDPERAADRLTAQRSGTVVVKLGRAGAIAVSDGHRCRQEAGSHPVVDTVGAGDAFAAGFLSGRLQGRDMPTCLRYANAMGGLATTVSGDTEGTPTAHDVARYIDAAVPE